MTKIHTNPPNHNSFRLKGYRERLTIDPTDENAKLMIEYYQNFETNKREQEATEEWQKNNLEYDLRTSDLIKQKCEASEAYAQNLYAALCNNEFMKNDVIPILTEQTWGCSWRYAGGIIADILERGDYIDWYCSGIKMHDSTGEDHPQGIWRDFVGEGEVTDEIRNDLLQLNWLVCVDKG